MEKESISQQLQIEQELINHIEASLRKALEWQSDKVGASRKLSTLRFVAASFHRHLQRLMAIHEFDGYMSQVVESNAQYQPAVEELKNEYDQLRQDVGRILSRLDRVSAGDLAALDATCDKLQAVLTGYDKHRHKETQLIQEAFLRDLGGTG